jgi:hypothetical protein
MGCHQLASGNAITPNPDSAPHETRHGQPADQRAIFVRGCSTRRRTRSAFFGIGLAPGIILTSRAEDIGIQRSRGGKEGWVRSAYSHSASTIEPPARLPADMQSETSQERLQSLPPAK